MTSSDRPPLYTQNPLGRFSNRATDYANYRPTYPATAIDWILDGLAPPSNLRVADVGAGTGISARLLAERGAEVWAVEPNAEMRSVATAHERVHAVAATAEATGLADASVQLVLCAQSFHWFQQAMAMAEFHRILQPGGRVALMWNDRNLDDPFTQAYSVLIDRAADRQIFDRTDRKSPTAMADSPFFTPFRSRVFVHTHPLDRDRLMGLALSASYIPKTGDRYEQLIEGLQTLYQDWVARTEATTVALSYLTRVYIAERVRRQV